jgi:hypothetical protein
MRSCSSKPLLLLALLFGLSVPCRAYSVLTHEEVVDMTWREHAVPLLRARFPSITPEQIKEAHAFAYGGCVIQDLGYYPHGSKLFSDLLHYVRTGDFVEALLRDSTTPDEFAFALGAMAHYTADETGHPYVNQVTAQEFPKLGKKYGPVVTYEEDKTAHLRTEFGFDVVGVARGKYAQEDYRNFIGFEVAKPLLNRAFEETYGLKIADVLSNEDSSIGSTRWAVHSLIPKMTKIALLTYHDEIEHANPGFDRKKFVYRMNRTTYEQKWGKTYKKPGFGSHVLAILIAILPKIGPLRALQLKLPNGDQQTIYIKSVNETVDLLQVRMDALRRVAAPQDIPPAASNGETPDEGTTADVKLIAKNAPTSEAIVAPALGQASAPVQTVSAAHPLVAATIVTGSELKRMPLDLNPINLDTGKAITPGEYGLSDETHAELLALVVKEDPSVVPAVLRQHLLDYYAGPDTHKNKMERKPKVWAKVQANLQTLKTMPVASQTAMR